MTAASSISGSDGALTADDAQTIADLLLAHPSVLRLFEDGLGDVATYRPGRRLAGVRVRAETVVAEVVVRPAGSLVDLARDLRRSVLAHYPDLDAVDIVIADIDFDADIDLRPEPRLPNDTAGRGGSHTEPEPTGGST